MSGERFPVPPEFARRAWVDEAAYRREYARSLADPQGFWADQAWRLDWYRAPKRIREVSYGPGDVHIRWYADGTLNASVNCLDRHLRERGSRAAILWEGDEARAHSDMYDDGANEPQNGITRRHGKGASVARLDAGVDWVTRDEYDRELADGPSRLFFSPVEAKGGWNTNRSKQTK